MRSRKKEHYFQHFIGNYFVFLFITGCLVLSFISGTYAQQVPLKTPSSTFAGVNPNDNAGWSTSIIGDVNNDGYDDLLIGAPKHSPGTINAGAAYLIFGKPELPAQTTALNQADVTFVGESLNFQAGMTVAGVGDVNGDNLADFVIAAPLAKRRTGIIHLFFGKATEWPKRVTLTSAEVTFLGEAPGDSAGFAVAGVGDVNNDGFNDFLISAPHAGVNPPNAGKVYLILGKSANWDEKINLSSVTTTFVGETPGSAFGMSLNGIGDINNDGIADFAIGAPSYSQNQFVQTGKVYLFFGNATPTWSQNSAANTADATLIGQQPTDLLGTAISNAADINGDDIDDFLVGASQPKSNGKVYVIFGKTADWAPDLVPETFAPSFIGESVFSLASMSLHLNDLNNDGFNDVLIGAPQNSQQAQFAGKVYLINGKAEGWLPAVSLTEVDTLLLGENSQDYAGHVVTSGNFDNDEYPELAIAAPGSDASHPDAGIVYLYQSPLKIVSSLTVLAPNGGESWAAGSQQTIAWASTGNIGSVKLSYSIDDKFTWKSIIEASPNDGEHVWDIPAEASALCYIKVEDVNESTIFDESDQPFVILVEETKSLTVLTPNGSENWPAGTTQTISWTSTGNIAAVKVSYSSDNKNTWQPVVDDTPNDGTHSWQVPPEASTTCFVKIEAVNDNTIADESDQPFTIVVPEPKSLTVTAPNGEEQWLAGSTQQISWTSTGDVAAVKISYAVDSDNGWTVIVPATPNDGTHPWQIPETASTACRVKIEDASDATINDESDQPFTIIVPEPKSLTITAPNGGEEWVTGTNQPITWTSTGSIANVKLSYSTNNKNDWKPIVATTPNDGNYPWQIPVDPSTDCFIKIEDVNDATVVDESDQAFTIKVYIPDSLKITAPNGGEKWTAGTTQKITWRSSGNIESVKLSYSTDNKNNWKPIVEKTANDGSEEWFIPEEATTTCFMKIEAITAIRTSDESDAPFTIDVPEPLTLELKTPNGNEEWFAETAQNITWTSTGTIGTVKISYSTDNKETWQTIAESTPNDGTHSWVIPSESSTTSFVKIENAENSEIQDESNQPFSILVPMLTVTQPDGGEEWFTGNTETVRWTSVGNIETVKISYSTDDAIHWTTIVESTENDGRHEWLIPEEPSTTCYIKVEDVNNGTLVDASNQTFTIAVPIPNVITLTTPNGGEKWRTGTEQDINWSYYGEVEAVKISFSADNKNSWQVIAESTPNDGNYRWLIPETPSNKCYIKIQDVADGEPVDVSDHAFSILAPPTLVITTPQGGECWLTNTDHKIIWQSEGDINFVNILYSDDAGENWHEIKRDFSNQNGTNSYLWKMADIPVINSYHCQIKILSTDDLAPCEDVSNEFAIFTENHLQVLAPNGGEYLIPGDAFEILWKASCVIPKVTIKYTTNDINASSVHWKTIATTENDGCYSWQVPDVNSSTCRITIEDAEDGKPIDLSDGNFTISGSDPKLRIVSPAADSCWLTDLDHKIVWYAAGSIARINLYYSDNGGAKWHEIKKDHPNTNGTNTYLWKKEAIPDINSNQCYIKVVSTDDQTPVEDLSDVFSIYARGHVKVITPNGGECWRAGERYKITWEAACWIDSIKIQYNLDDEDEWESIAYGTENDGHHTWRIPDDIPHSTKYKIKVARVNCEPYDISDNFFTIWNRDEISVLWPNGNNCLKAGERYEIKWEAACWLGNLKIQYSTDNGENWETIVYDTPNDGTHLWKVPEDIHSTQCLIKIAELDCEPYDVSDETFTIWSKEEITVLTPNGGEVLHATTKYKITWEAPCFYEKVKIKYSTDNGESWTCIDETTNDGSYKWTVPAVNSTRCLIRVQDLDGEPFDDSDKPFTIWKDASLTVIWPNGGECLNERQPYEIRWIAPAWLDYVKIRLSIDGGNHWSMIEECTSNDSSYWWVVPDLAETTDKCLIKISDKEGNFSDLSDEPFTISDGQVLEVLTPNGGETLYAGSEYKITWRSNASSSNKVKIEYTCDAGVNWTVIRNETDNDGNASWEIPDTPSDYCLVKITDRISGSADVSDDYFKISNAPYMDFDATTMTGIVPLNVEFINLSTGDMNHWLWDFGDGQSSKEREPAHIYEAPGTYTVKLKANYESKVDSVVKINFIHVHPEESQIELDFVAGCQTEAEQDWSNAIDGDTYGWDGTVVMEGEDRSAVFQISETGENINSFALLTNTGVGHDDRWVKQFRVQVSNVGTEPADFTTVLEDNKSGGEMEIFQITPVKAKYVKLVVVSPKTEKSHLGEFEAFLDNTSGVVPTWQNVVPKKFHLCQSYPNPFNPSTTIRFELPKSTEVRLLIYNLLGEEIRKLLDEKKSPGVYEIQWDGRNNRGEKVASGIYLYVLSTSEYRDIKKMLLTK